MSTRTLCREVFFFRLIIISFFINSCIDCETLQKNYRTDECILIVKEKPGFGDTDFNFKGIHPFTKRQCDCRSDISYRWWSLYKKDIDINDTIIKKKGELIFSIHKSDTILRFNWKCKEKKYE